MSKTNADEFTRRLKGAGFSDEFIANALSPEILSEDHTDMGSGHFDFPKHADLHLDMPVKVEARTGAGPVSNSLELREAVNEWIRILNDRMTQVERRVESLERKQR